MAPPFYTLIYFSGSLPAPGDSSGVRPMQKSRGETLPRLCRWFDDKRKSSDGDAICMLKRNGIRNESSCLSKQQSRQASPPAKPDKHSLTKR